MPGLTFDPTSGMGKGQHGLGSNKTSFGRRGTTQFAPTGVMGDRNVAEMQGLEIGATKQQLQMQKQLFDMLFGGGGAVFGGAVGGGQPSLNLDQFGAGQRARINQDFQNLQGDLTAQLSDRGLGGSSLVASMGRGLEDARQQSLLDLEDTILGQKVGLHEGAANRQTQLLMALLGGIL